MAKFWFQVQRCFLGGFPPVFSWFCWFRFLKTKKHLNFFVFWREPYLKGTLLKVFSVLAQNFRRYVKTIHAKKQKRPESFWFLTILQPSFYPNNPQKKGLGFFCFFMFQGQNQKKAKPKKKQTWASDQTFSEKFCFFGFLEVFLILSMGFSQGVSKYCFLLVFSSFLKIVGFPYGFSPNESSNIVFFQLVLIMCRATTHKTSLKNNWLLHIYAHKYIYTYVYHIYIYTRRDTISKCSEVDLGGYHIYIHIYYIYNHRCIVHRCMWNHFAASICNGIERTPNSLAHCHMFNTFFSWPKRNNLT